MMTESAATEIMEAVETVEMVAGSWLTANAKTLLPVPPFADEAWLQEKITLQSNIRLVRDLHRYRECIRAFTGYPWPEECPDASNIVRVVLGGLQHANFIRVTTLCAMAALGPRKGRAYHLFKTFSKKISWAYTLPAKQGGKPGYRSMPEVAGALLASGDRAAALGFIYLNTLGASKAGTFAELAERKNLHEVAEFLAAAAGLDDGFEWKEDIDGGRGELTVWRLKRAAMHSGGSCKQGEAVSGDTNEDGTDPDGDGDDGANAVFPEADADLPGGIDAGLPKDTSESVPEETAASFTVGAVSVALPSISDGEAARLSWLAALARMREAVGQAEASCPDDSTLDSVLACVRAARAAAKAWRAAQPRLVDAGPLLARVRAVLEAACELLPAGTDPAAVPVPDGPARVTPAVARDAEGLIGTAETEIAEAAAVRDAVRAVAADLDNIFTRMDEMVALKVEASAHTDAAIAAATVAATLISDACAAVQEAGPDVPEPARKSGAGKAQEDPPLAPAESQPPLGPTDGGPAVAVAPHAPEAPDRTAVAKSVLPEPLDDPGFELAEEMSATLLADREPKPESGSGTGAHPSTEAEPGSGESLPPIMAADPAAREVEARIADLVSARAFGSAYHLARAAARIFPDLRLPVSADELRLAAMSGHINQSAMTGSPLLNQVVSGAVAAVAGSPGGGDADAARRIMLASACAELAMFHPAVPATVGVEAVAEGPADLRDAFHELSAAVAEGARLTFVTPALLRTVAEEVADGRHVEDARRAVLGNLEAFSRLRFSWVPANKIRAAMHGKGGPLHDLKEVIEAGGGAAPAAAQAFATAFRDRAAVMSLVDRIDNGGGSKFKAMDGAAREKMVSAFSDLTSLCADYAAAAAAVPSLRTDGQKVLVRRIAHGVADAAAKACAALAPYAASGSSILAAAAGFGMDALDRLRHAAQGHPASAGLHDHLMAVHGPLLWLPGLHWGNSWLPAPYNAEEVLEALLRSPVPPADMACGDAGYRAAVGARLTAGSFVAAGMLVQGAVFYGVGEAAAADMAELCEAELEDARLLLQDRLEATRRLIDKVQRMGGLVRVESASVLLASFEKIDPASLPSDVSLDARSEEEEPVQILDFSSALEVVGDVEDRIRSLLEEPLAGLQARLDALGGRALPADIDHVRRILSGDSDLVTAAEYIGFMEEGGTLPEPAAESRRFRAFYPAVPDALSAAPKEALNMAEEALREGRDMPSLPFSRVPQEGRTAALEIVEMWRSLRRRVDGDRAPQDVNTFLERFLTYARLSPEVITPVVKDRHLPPKTYMAEVRLTIPEDKDSLLLPDYGSLPKFTYRVCVVSKLPADGELSLICRGSGNYAVIVIVMSVVDAQRRLTLAVQSVEQKRTVLVIDEAVLLHALAEQEFRPPTMFECAQPFSYAAPYRDYGNAAVPPEMFFGRESEIRKISDRMGSCIVYGGRRLGKTALLRHVQALSAGPGTGNSVIVAYANIRDIAATPGRIWDMASHELPSVFLNPAKGAADFATRIRTWLRTDEKRRILLLLDEADGFIDGDSKQNFKEFGVLQGLMDSDSRRFKFVLAGLHNVTRIVRTENSPLKQIASDPLRIGPLVDSELRDAERLVTRPMAARGYEFDSRSDVWRILSHCNYYPVLVQTFCAWLLDSLDRGIRHRKRTWSVTDRHVREAIDSEEIRKQIEAKYSYTIRDIDPRYELIACVVAERALNEKTRVGEGMTTVEVLDAVSVWWPPAFDHPNRLEIVRDLLDEMVGLGVLRPGPSGTWALRSHAILRLLDQETVDKRLVEFSDMPPPRAFDPRSMRRGLAVPGQAKDRDRHPCPLTMGQEHDLFFGHARLSVVLGSPLSDIGLVADALRSADAVTPEGAPIGVTARIFAGITELVDAVRTLNRASAPSMVVVDPRSPWEPAWVDALARQRSFKEGGMRVVFVGGPVHARLWAMGTPNPYVRTVPLQTWADTYVEHELGRDNLPVEQFAPELRRVAGGFNRPMSQILAAPGSADKFSSRMRAAETRLLKNRDLLSDLGLVPPMAEVFRQVAEWADESGLVGADAVKVGAGEALAASGMSAAQAVKFGLSMAVLSAMPLLPGEHPDTRSYRITSLLRTALAVQAAA